MVVELGREVEMIEDRTAHLLKLASKATARALQDRLALRNVSYGHWTLLRILWREDGLSVTELSRRASVAKPAAVAAIRGMELEGYVVRRQRDGNLKSIYIHLTDAGRALEAELVPYAIEVNELALHGVGESKARMFREVLTRIIQNLSIGAD